MAKPPRPPCWKPYTRLNRWTLGLLVGGLPATVLAALVIRCVLGVEGPGFLVVASLIWSGAWAWTALRLARWPCPRCGAPWLSPQDVRLGAPRCCARCGLGLYEEPGPSVEAGRR